MRVRSARKILSYLALFRNVLILAVSCPYPYLASRGNADDFHVERGPAQADPLAYGVPVPEVSFDKRLVDHGSFGCVFSVPFREGGVNANRRKFRRLMV